MLTSRLTTACQAQRQEQQSQIVLSCLPVYARIKARQNTTKMRLESSVWFYAVHHKMVVHVLCNERIVYLQSVHAHAVETQTTIDLTT